jgi:hypothetical protein
VSERRVFGEYFELGWMKNKWVEKLHNEELHNL